MKNILLLTSAMLLSLNVNAQSFTGTDLSGTYACIGKDKHEGDFKSKVTLTLNPAHSYDHYASYDFRMDVVGYGAYHGTAAADGDNMAVTFAHEDPSTKDYGTGIAKVHHEKGKVRFTKFYFEEAYKGGSTGTETCIKD